MRADRLSCGKSILLQGIFPFIFLYFLVLPFSSFCMLAKSASPLCVTSIEQFAYSIKSVQIAVKVALELKRFLLRPCFLQKKFLEEKHFRSNSISVDLSFDYSEETSKIFVIDVVSSRQMLAFELPFLRSFAYCLKINVLSSN